MSTASTTYELIKEIFLLLDDGDRQLLGEFNLTVPRFYALFHLGNEPGMSPNRLSELMFCDKSNITRLVKGMEAENLVVRYRHESDGRSIRLFLTEEGVKVRANALEAHLTYNQQRFGRGLLEDVDTLRNSLRKLKSNLEAELQHMAETTYGVPS